MTATRLLVSSSAWCPRREPPPRQATTLTRQVAGWSSLIAAVLLLASLFTSAATNATAGVGSAPVTVTDCATHPLYADQHGWAPLYARCTDALP